MTNSDGMFTQLDGMSWEQARSLFRVFFDLLPEGVALFDPHHPETLIVACNSSYAAMNGYTVEEMVGKSVHILHFEDPHIVTSSSEPQQPELSFVDRLRYQGTIQDRTLHRRKDGSVFPVEFKSHLVKIDGREFIIGIDRDVSSEERFEDLSRNQQALHAIFEYSPDGIVLIDTTDDQYTIAECNVAYARINGYARNELLGKQIDILNASADEARRVGLHLLPDSHLEFESGDYHATADEIEELGVVHNPHSWHKRKDGNVVAIEYSSCVLTIGDKKMILGIDRDISERRRAQHLDYDRNIVLEFIAMGAPVEQSLDYLAQLLKKQMPDVRSAFFTYRAGAFQFGASRHGDAVYDPIYGDVPPPELVQQDAALLRAATNFDVESSLILKQLLFNSGTVSSEDLANARELRDDSFVKLLAGAESLWLLPIVNPDGVKGVLALWAPRPRHFLRSERKAVEMAQRLAAVAIEQQDMAQRLAFQAEHDALTGLPNRHLLEDRLQQSISYARRKKSPLALLFLDLDGFKNINDTLGHNAGDTVLREVSQRLKNCVRESDTVARLGGDEFTVVLPDVSSTQGVQTVADKIIATLQMPFHVLDHEMHLSSSIGIAMFPEDAEEPGILLRNADSAMYRAKARGKGRFEFYAEEMGRERENKLRLKTRLREAFANDEFELFYQPQIDVRSERVVGLEALIRWKHPVLGTMLPISFIPAAEENGLILQIGEWVIRQACREVQILQEKLGDVASRVLNGSPHISVNISAIQLGHSEFRDVVQRALQETGIDPSCLVLELTESAIMRHVDEVARQMDKLHQLGVRLAIDDFGTGYSSLSYLQKLPLQELKIDRLSVRGLDNDVSARAFVAAITALGHNFGLKVVAEGIETREELDAAAQLSCDIAQGYFIARPLQLDGLIQWLQERGQS